MPNRDELLQLLGARRRLYSLRPEPPLGHPASWRAWLTRAVRMDPRLPAMPELVSILAARSPPPPPSPRQLHGRWQQFRALFRQGWDVESAEPAGLRYGAMAASLALNALFALLLLWLMYLQFMLMQAPAETETVRIQITGFGTPQATGGGSEAPLAEAAPAARSAAQPQPSARTAAASAARTQALETDPVVAEQPLQVTESATPDDYVLPPTRQLDMPMPAAPALQARALPAREDIPAPLPPVPALQSELRAREIQVRPIAQIEQAIPARSELPETAMRSLPIRAPDAELRQGMPSARPLPGIREDSAGTTAAATGSARSATGTASPAADGQAPGQRAADAGAGPALRSQAGGWPSPRRDDDWGDAARNRAGQANGGERGDARGSGASSGLLNADGSPRLAGDGFKPRFPDPYKEGTWLKRPSLGYRGTMFDGIWQPPESLLQEWVRRGVKSVDIPLPGSKVKIRCIVSVLQAAGACFPVAGKEGMHDQPAIARPPPKVPFKPELFENPADLSTPKPPPDAPTRKDPASPSAGG